ncbi:hypothetical protein DFH08DRAFT_984079 [Mycena albidolilacea]|uniref:Uncharacterized protein n=1 Tax=Mycena albidolilacea TaxID=1033008 RepID=A0AAD7AWR9_9AGAR|nr:hypothetical protein DFH08DRAFT_984079 [Mycena albidolilacea]
MSSAFKVYFQFIGRAWFLVRSTVVSRPFISLGSYSFGLLYLLCSLLLIAGAKHRHILYGLKQKASSEDSVWLPVGEGACDIRLSQDINSNGDFSGYRRALERQHIDVKRVPRDGASASEYSFAPGALQAFQDVDALPRTPENSIESLHYQAQSQKNVPAVPSAPRKSKKLPQKESTAKKMSRSLRDLGTGTGSSIGLREQYLEAELRADRERVVDLKSLHTLPTLPTSPAATHASAPSRILRLLSRRSTMKTESTDQVSWLGGRERTGTSVTPIQEIAPQMPPRVPAWDVSDEHPPVYSS